MTPDELERYQARLRALRASLGLLEPRSTDYDGSPTDPAERASWLAERARLRELALPVLNPPVPTPEETAKVVPFRRRR